MDLEDVTVVRIYVTEEQDLADRIVDHLHDKARVPGVTVFRAITGYGHHGEVRSAGLLTLSLNLPLVIEFFDQPERARAVLDDLEELLDGVPVLAIPARGQANPPAA